MDIKYHAMANAPATHVVLSADVPIKGWYKPSSLGVYIAGKSEIVMTLADAKSHMDKIIADGGTVTRGADISQAGGVSMITDKTRKTW